MSECPNCGAPDTNIIPVWEDKDRYYNEEQPKFIGCTSCHQMMRLDLLRDPDEDTTPPQTKLTKYERKRLSARNAVGNQNNNKLTIIEWQCVKGAALHYGVTDWIAKADSTLTKGENVSLMEQRATRNGGKTLRETGTVFEYYSDESASTGEVTQ